MEFLKFIGRNNTNLNLTACNIINDTLAPDLIFFEDDMPANCNEINNSYVGEFYRKGASQICFDMLSYTDYGSADKMDKKSYSEAGGVKIYMVLINKNNKKRKF